MILFTIGHGNQSIESLVHLLAANGIRQVIDVRTSPYSRFCPQFNKENLERSLTQNGIRYAHAGAALGGRPAEPASYRRRALPDEGADYLHEVDYAEVRTRPSFLQGVSRLLDLAAQQTTAILCSEEDPAHCHRHHLIALHLLAAHPEVTVKHIRGDGVVFGAQSLLASVDGPEAEQLPLI